MAPMRDRIRALLVAAPMFAAIGLGAAAGVAAGPSDTSPGVVHANDALSCLAPTDAAGLARVLGAAGSPLADDAPVIVDAAVDAGIDPRFVVAVAAHETMLLTYGPAQAIHNPFGLGPGMSFATDADAVRYAARLLDRWYVGEGRSTIPLIGSKWAPVGAANDPTNLNANWNAGVSRYFAALGGDPYRPVTLATQDATPECDATPASALSVAGAAAPVPRPGSGPATVVVWGGNPPEVAGPSPADGADPASRGPAAVASFAFPAAVPAGAEVWYAEPARTAGGSLAVTLTLPADTHVVAATDGRLIGATPSERRAGIAFWVVRDDGDRIGYGPLASYAPGVAHGAEVPRGAPLGRAAGTLAVAWTRQGTAINPYPLLAATRPPDPGPSTPR